MWSQHQHIVSRRRALASLAAGVCGYIVRPIPSGAAAENGAGPVFSPSGPDAERYGAVVPAYWSGMAQPGGSNLLSEGVCVFHRLEPEPWIFKRRPRHRAIVPTTDRRGTRRSGPDTRPGLALGIGAPRSRPLLCDTTSALAP
jgi:hypothetical protein